MPLWARIGSRVGGTAALVLTSANYNAVVPLREKLSIREYEEYVALERLIRDLIKGEHIEIITSDPTTLTDDYLKGVQDRINKGNASVQDYNYQKELERRKKEGVGLFAKEKKREILTFMQGKDDKAIKIEVEIPDGFKKTKLRSHGQPVFSDGKIWITPDQDGHNGGVWKVYDKEKDVGKKQGVGTFDEKLNKIKN